MSVNRVFVLRLMLTLCLFAMAQSAWPDIPDAEYQADLKKMIQLEHEIRVLENEFFRVGPGRFPAHKEKEKTQLRGQRDALDKKYVPYPEQQREFSINALAGAGQFGQLTEPTLKYLTPENKRRYEVWEQRKTAASSRKPRKTEPFSLESTIVLPVLGVLAILGVIVVGRVGWRAKENAQTKALQKSKWEQAKNNFEKVQKIVREAQLKTFNCLFSSPDLSDAEKVAQINKAFDTKKGEVHIHYARSNDKIDPLDMPLQISFSISRSIAVMRPIERELLRAAWLFRMAGIWDYNRFIRTLLSMVWGDGSGATLHGLRYNRFTISEEVAEQYQRKTRDILQHYLLYNARIEYQPMISRRVDDIEELHNTRPDDPTVKEVYNRMHAGSNWFTPSDIRGSIFDPPADANGQPDVRYALRLGHLDGIEGDAPLAYFRNAALATIAPPGAGKTQCQVIPNLLTWQGPAFVLDVKGELYENTAGYRAKHFGPVYKFDLFDQDTHGFNPFSFLHDDPAQLWDDASFLADMMFLPTGGHDKFWEESGKQLLHGTLAAMVFEEEERSFDTVLDKLASPQRLLDMAYVLENCGNSNFVRMSEQINGLLDEKASSKTLSGILQHTYVSLQNLASPGIHCDP